MPETLDLAWHSAVLRVLKSHHPHETSLKDIYLEVGKYRKLSILTKMKETGSPRLLFEKHTN